MRFTASPGLFSGGTYLPFAMTLRHYPVHGTGPARAPHYPTLITYLLYESNAECVAAAQEKADLIEFLKSI